MTMGDYPAASAGLRISPVDLGNLNRACPGNALAAPTEMIAGYNANVRMPKCDGFFDCDPTGTPPHCPAMVMRTPGRKLEEHERLVAPDRAFDGRNVWVFKGGGGPTATARSAMGAAGCTGQLP